MKYVMKFFGFLVLFFVVVTVITAMFIGTGAFVSYLFDFSLFNSALLCISSTFVLSFFVFTKGKLIAKSQEAVDESDELQDMLDEIETDFDKQFNSKRSTILLDLKKINKKK